MKRAKGMKLNDHDQSTNLTNSLPHFSLALLLNFENEKHSHPTSHSQIKTWINKVQVWMCLVTLECCAWFWPILDRLSSAQWTFVKRWKRRFVVEDWGCIDCIELYWLHWLHWLKIEVHWGSPTCHWFDRISEIQAPMKPSPIRPCGVVRSHFASAGVMCDVWCVMWCVMCVMRDVWCVMCDVWCVMCDENSQCVPSLVLSWNQWTFRISDQTKSTFVIVWHKFHVAFHLCWLLQLNPSISQSLGQW